MTALEEKIGMLTELYIERSTYTVPHPSKMNTSPETEKFSEIGENRKALVDLLNEIDPFEIPLDVMKKLDFNLVKLVQKRFRNVHNKLIIETLRNSSSRYFVFCDGKVVLESNEPYGPSDDDIRKIEEKMGKPCFIIGRFMPIEDLCVSDWSLTNSKIQSTREINDFYPTIPIFVGAIDMNDDQIFKEGTKIIADFDTGNPIYYAFDEQLAHNLGIRPTRLRSEIYPPSGKGFDYFLQFVKVGVIDINGNRKCAPVLVWFVVDWNQSTFKEFNPNRKAFVGRNLLFELNLTIQLNPSSKQSTIIKVC